MLTRKLKSLPLVALAAALFLLPAPRAEAWRYVCLENKGGYLASLIVVYGFEDFYGVNKLPKWAHKWTRDAVDGPPASQLWGHESLSYVFPAMTHSKKVEGFKRVAADGLIRTDRAGFPVLQWRCVDISALEEGELFYVIAATNDNRYKPGAWTVCDTHESNPHPYYAQQERPYSEIWFEAHGVSWDHWCVYGKEVQR